MALVITLMVMDGELEDQLTNVLTRFNGPDAELGLFISVDAPTPETELADLTEPTLDGYARVSLEDLWTAPARDLAGVWSAQTEVFTFTVDPGETDGEDVYGAFVAVAGVVVAAGLFTVPFTWEDGSPLMVRVVYTQYAAIILQQLSEP